MLKLGIEIKEVDNTLNINLMDPTKKQLETATENEKILSQKIKDLLDNRLLYLLDEEENKDKK